MSAPAKPSFEADDARTRVDALGRIGHENHLANSERFTSNIRTVAPGVWCVTGNGLSNQTFIDAPDGIIAVDTGESIEEMTAALRYLRTVTSRPIAAVVYTHFHYVGGTQAVLTELGRDLPIYAHARVDINRRRTGGEISPTYGRGLVEQFGISLPPDGPDGLINIGLGLTYRNAEHSPHSPGYVPPTHTFDEPCELNIAGLKVFVHPAPSDADDSATFWFPDLNTAIHNLVWPVLFNVFAIRGEEYRDPRTLIAGLDHLISLNADHLVPTHGAPMSGAADIRRRATKYRDSIQFMWDQTVRLTNRGFSGEEIASAIRLPDCYADDFITTELYGVVEHHVRQIRCGLFGFFDGDEAKLFPLDRRDHSNRMIDAMGGRDRVREMVRASRDRDTRWSLELASMLVHSDEAADSDRALLAEVLRTIAHRTSAANIRNWCLTRARHYDGTSDMARHNQHRLNTRALENDTPEAAVHILRVLLDPELLGDTDLHIGWRFADGAVTGLHLRHGVACCTDGQAADTTITCTRGTWAAILGSRTSLSAEIRSGSLTISHRVDEVVRSLAAFDVDGLRQ